MSVYKQLILVLVGACAFYAACLWGFYLLTKPEPKPAQEFIACMRFGCVYCGEMTETACGINLTKCSDTRDYFCMHDLAYKAVP